MQNFRRRKDAFGSFPPPSYSTERFKALKDSNIFLVFPHMWSLGIFFPLSDVEEFSKVTCPSHNEGAYTGLKL